MYDCTVVREESIEKSYINIIMMIRIFMVTMLTAIMNILVMKITSLQKLGGERGDCRRT